MTGSGNSGELAVPVGEGITKGRVAVRPPAGAGSSQ